MIYNLINFIFNHQYDLRMEYEAVRRIQVKVNVRSESLEAIASNVISGIT